MQQEEGSGRVESKQTQAPDKAPVESDDYYLMVRVRPWQARAAMVLAFALTGGVLWSAWGIYQGCRILAVIEALLRR
jgi:hypothetical protein